MTTEENDVTTEPEPETDAKGSEEKAMVEGEMEIGSEVEQLPAGIYAQPEPIPGAIENPDGSSTIEGSGEEMVEIGQHQGFEVGGPEELYLPGGVPASAGMADRDADVAKARREVGRE